MNISTRTVNHIIALFGLITVFFFVLLGIYGGFYNSFGNFLFREVSYSISPYTHYQDVTVPLYKQYNLYLILFSILLCFGIRNSYAKLGALYLSFAGIVGFILLRFPMDPNGSGSTLQGVSHNIYAIVMSLYITIALYLFSLAFAKVKTLHQLSHITFLSSLVFLSSTLLIGVSAFLSRPLFVGFVERLAIGTYLLWIIVVALEMLLVVRKEKRNR
jgi:hypothetical protein